MRSTGLAVPLFIVFLVLKLVGSIDWSWWWITAPLWAPITAVLVIWGVTTATVAAGVTLADRIDKRKANA